MRKYKITRKRIGEMSEVKGSDSDCGIEKLKDQTRGGTHGKVI